MGMAAIGWSTTQNKINAAPPNVAKAGIPSTEARKRIAIAIGPEWWKPPGQISTPPASPAAKRPANTRGANFSEPRRRIRIAITPKPSGRTLSTTHIGMPYARIVPASRSDWTNWKEAKLKNAETVADTPVVKMRETVFQRPRRAVSPRVESESSLPSRAAIAPPSIPTTSTMCCTIVVDAGIPTWKTRRRTLSARGTKIITRRATETTAFSAVVRQVVAEAGPRLAGGFATVGEGGKSLVTFEMLPAARDSRAEVA